MKIWNTTYEKDSAQEQMIVVDLARLFVEAVLTRFFRETRINGAINATFAVLATRIGTGGEAAICMRGSTVL